MMLKGKALVVIGEKICNSKSFIMEWSRDRALDGIVVTLLMISFFLSEYHGSSQGSFQCCWKDCKYRGTFTRKGLLMRHVETQYVTPRAFDCTICGKSFSRKDNMREHLGRVHLERR